MTETDASGSVPLVSVALCTYNGERFLPAQLDSLLAQDYPRFEIVACDDASTDATPDILARYAARDERLRVFAHAQNLGVKKNFEFAMAKCRGELIAPCDQDDIWLPEKLSALSRQLSGSDALLVYHDSEFMDEADRPEGRRISQGLVMLDRPEPAAFAFCNCVAGHALMVRRQLLERALPLPPGLFHDWWLAFVACSLGQVRYCGQRLVYYRQHATSVTDMTHRRDAANRGRARGYRLREMDDITQRLAAFARFPGPAQEFYRALLALWMRRRRQFLSLRLTGFLLRRRERVFAIERPGSLRRTRRALKFLAGIRLKRLLQPFAYAEQP